MLWSECWDESFRTQRWAKQDQRLPNSFFTQLTPTWQRDCVLRSDDGRRQALVEIDVLVAQALGLTLDERITIERTSGTFARTILNDTLPGGPVERTITYEAPWMPCNR